MKKGFTLIELLVVIAIVAVLAVTVLLTLNPSELLKQARDTNRIADLATLNKALSLYQSEFSSGSMGVTSTIYISIPDSSSSCANLGLPLLPSGWSYSCKTSANVRNTNGTGWIPVTLNQMSAGSPVASLPVDANNSTSTGRYYTYVVDAGGKFALTGALESQKYIRSVAAVDGGVEPARLERGSNLQLVAQQEGLVAYWSLDEGAGSTANDLSGSGNTGDLLNSPTWSSGKVGGALTFDGTSNHVLVPASESLRINSGSIAFWFKAPATVASTQEAIFIEIGTTGNRISPYIYQATKYLALYSTASGGFSFTPNTIANDDAWHHLVTSWNASSSAMYLDGVVISQTFGNYQQGLPNPAPVVIGRHVGGGYFYKGLLDDVRLYNRPLSQGEIGALYLATR